MPKQSEFCIAQSVIGHAAELLLKCAGFLDDCEEAAREDAGHTDTYFAVDADVISLYLEPISKLGYLDVFEGSDIASTKRPLTFLLGDFLFKSTEPLLPRHRQTCRFLLVPPHDEELLSILSAIHRKLVQISTGIIDPGRFEALSAAFNKYQVDRDEKALQASLSNHVSDLAELYNPYVGPKAALTRYAELPETTFQRLATYRESGFAFPSFDPMNCRQDRDIAGPLIERWEELLAKHQRRKNQPTYALRTDAEALATIEFINLRLRSDRKRLVLVTGSSYLFDAANAYGAPPGEQHTFAEMYLRHPQAFLAHPNFFRRADGEAQFKLIDWLNLFFPSGLLPPIQQHGTVDRALLRGILTGTNDGVQQVVHFLTSGSKGLQPISHLINEWETQIDAVGKDRYADGLGRAAEFGVRKLADKLEELQRQNRWSIQELRALVFEESLRSISKLYSKTVWVGLWSKAAREQSKGVPALRFDDTYRSIEPYLDKVISLQLKTTVTEADLTELLALNIALEKADESLYHAHVIHALAFAVKGHNYATLTLAKTALVLCDNLKRDQRGYRLGREAAYLACIAARRSAKDRSGLRNATEFLREAVERENPEAKSETEDIRFTSERLAIETRLIYCDNFCDEKFDAEQTSVVLNKLNLLVKWAHAEKNERVRHWVLRQALTNYFSLVLVVRELGQGRDVAGDAEITANLQNLEVLESTLADAQFGRKPEDDPYAHVISLICRAIWDADKRSREKARRAARDICNALKTKPDHVPYHKKRLEFLEKFIHH